MLIAFCYIEIRYLACAQIINISKNYLQGIFR